MYGFDVTLDPIWIEHFCWIPQKIHGHWYWLCKVYKISTNDPYYRNQEYQTWRYGTLFDVLKEAGDGR